MKLEEYYRPRLSEAGYDLLAVFSRFEYALKKGGFRRGNYPDAAWPTFAERLPHQFFQKMREAEEARIYFEAPPDHLVTTAEGGVAWSGAPNIPNDAASLFQSIKTARNNLFHGDKKHDNERDNQHMKAALFVLNEAYQEAEGNEAFDRFVSAMEFGLYHIGPLLPLTKEAGRCGAARKSRHSLRLQKLIRAEVDAAARSGHSLNV